MRKLVFAVGLALAWGIASAALAQGAKKTAKPPAEKKTKVEADAPSQDELRVKIHQTMAALIEARAAKNPDEEKIGKLIGQLDSLRQQCRSQWRGVAGAGPVAGQGPWGGARYGFGMDAGRGPGYRPGQGPAAWGPAAWGPAARGPGRGLACPYSQGGGRGYGYGPGPGYGRGQGQGRGWMNRAGQGYGRGPAYGRGGGYGGAGRW